jgi:hypothetical protein
LRQRIGSPFTSSGSRAGRLMPLRSCASEPKPLARTQSEIAFAERIGAAGPAVAYGSAVNEDGGKRNAGQRACTFAFWRPKAREDDLPWRC